MLGRGSGGIMPSIKNQIATHLWVTIHSLRSAAVGSWSMSQKVPKSNLISAMYLNSITKGQKHANVCFDPFFTAVGNRYWWLLSSNVVLTPLPLSLSFSHTCWPIHYCLRKKNIQRSNTKKKIIERLAFACFSNLTFNLSQPVLELYVKCIEKCCCCCTFSNYLNFRLFCFRTNLFQPSPPRCYCI